MSHIHPRSCQVHLTPPAYRQKPASVKLALLGRSPTSLDGPTTLRVDAVEAIAGTPIVDLKIAMRKRRRRRRASRSLALPLVIATEPSHQSALPWTALKT
jgi:hypothetical protein